MADSGLAIALQSMQFQMVGIQLGRTVSKILPNIIRLNVW
jgi:hypothetical protein